MLFIHYQYIPLWLIVHLLRAQWCKRWRACSTTSSDTQPLVNLSDMLYMFSNFLWYQATCPPGIHLTIWFWHFMNYSNSSSKLFSTNFKFPLVPNVIILISTHHRHRSSLFYCWATSRNPQSCQGAFFCFFGRFDSQVRIYFLSDLCFHDLYLNQRRPSMSLTLQNNKVWNCSVQSSSIISKYADWKF